MTDFPDLKIKAAVNFPANATGGTGIDVEKVNGNFVIDLAYDDFAPPVSGVSDPAHQNILLWNSLTEQYALTPISLFGGGGGIPDAPNDGVQYGRQSTAWTPVVGGTGPAGPQGPTGPTGPAGPQGPPGTSGSGSGNVTGPSSAVSGNIATYNGTTGTLIQDGGQTIAGLAALTQVVRYDAVQALTAAQQAQARMNVYAAPFDALAFSGMQINGSFDISQALGVNAGFALPAAAAYLCDGWIAIGTGSYTASAFQSINPGYFPGMNSLLYINVTAGQASLGTNDRADFFTRVEGSRIARLGWGFSNPQSLTIGFWSNHTQSGLYSVSVRNNPPTRSYATTYNHAAGNVLQYNVITIPGCTDGTWASDNTIGMNINFVMAAGSALTSTSANQWLTTNTVAAPGQINGVATPSTFRIGGVVVLPGIDAPSAARAPLIMRPADQELLLCQRYLYVYKPPNAAVVNIGFGGAIDTSRVFAILPLHVPMRTPATGLTVSAPGHFMATNTVGTGIALTALAFSTAGVDQFSLLATAGSGLVAGQPSALQSNNASAQLTLTGAQL